MKCKRPSPTEPKHFSPLRRLTAWTCVSLACTCRSTAQSAHSPTLGLYSQLLYVTRGNKAGIRVKLTMFPLSTSADGSTYHTLTVFTSSDLGFYEQQFTTRSSSAIWNMSRNSGEPCSNAPFLPNLFKETPWEILRTS